MVLLHSGGSIQILLHLFGRFLVVEHIYTYRKSSNKPPEAYLQNFLGGGLFEGGGGRLISKFSVFLKGRHKNDIIFSMK